MSCSAPVTTYWPADMILHTLNASPTSAAFADCLRLASHEDSILLMGDGVYGAIAGSPSCEMLASSKATVLVLESDANATGCAERLGQFPVLNMDGFVTLTEQYPRQLAWY